MKQPITEKEELVQDKPNISNVTIGDKVWEELFWMLQLLLV